MSNKSPAYQFYPSDFLSDRNTAVMSAEQVGAYRLLMDYCWIEGSLPDDLEELSVLARLGLDVFEEHWEKRIKRCFAKTEKGEWVHPRLEKERQKQKSYRSKKADAGRKGAEARWGDSDKNTPDDSKNGGATSKNGTANKVPITNDGSSSLSSSSTSEEKNPSGSKRKNFKPPDEPEVSAYLVEKHEYPPPLAERVANIFWTFYDQKNWKIGKNKMSKWKTALGRAISETETGWDSIKREITNYGKTKTDRGHSGQTYSGDDLQDFIDIKKQYSY